MLVPTLYVCHQVERSRREDERLDAERWRMLCPARPSAHSERSVRERRVPRVIRLRTPLGRSGI
jgi:hypothetical protein